MTRTTSRPRMAAIYSPGTVRARRWHGDGDVRGYRPPSGWSARVDLSDIHPITGSALPRAACRVPCAVCRVVDCGDEGIAVVSTAPRPGAAWAR